MLHWILNIELYMCNCVSHLAEWKDDYQTTKYKNGCERKYWSDHNRSQYRDFQLRDEYVYITRGNTRVYKYVYLFENKLLPLSSVIYSLELWYFKSN